MKMITLIFLGILTFAFAESHHSSTKCLNVPVKPNFEPQKYFKGKWFLTNVKRSAELTTNVCQESKSNILEDGIVNHIIYAYAEVMKPQFILTNCTGDVKNKQEKVFFHCNEMRSDKIEHFHWEGTVVETDYEHFAIFYMCIKDGDNPGGDDFLVLNRKEDGEATDPRIAETLKSHGLILSELLSRKNAGCPTHPDF